ncbi:hypothetical protein T552_01416 [Pneumocystis carinii B80]|uniref:Rad21/Rec8-like protein N-terminal domain-containing protein n=1 Tax=Pneumocystis carinii (strain B80) TaxID=1408658 RepID=A0A0W4ZK78_PNEC8|nr:hypothetical protein T552_01416 [Pneumocystis carinii B80]KTW28786.1 hypothetical protein T552_01416 [Pneumocystis carinii B80]
MFYSKTILSKKGPLAKIWLAAHWEKKLSKFQFLQTSIEQSVNAIVNQEQIPIALRLSGQLLLGVVKVYSRKAHYLLEDCNEALMKIKMTFKPGNVDISRNNTNVTLQSAQLVLPEMITEFDLLVPEPVFNIIDIDLNAKTFNFSHVSKKQDITLMSAFEPSIEIGRRNLLDLEDDPLIQVDEDNEIDLDLGIGDNDLQNDVSIEVGRDAAPEPRFSQEFSNIISSQKNMDASISGMDLDMIEDENYVESNDIHNSFEPIAESSIRQVETISRDERLISEDGEASVESGNDILRGEMLEFEELKAGTPEARNKVTQLKNQRSQRKAIEDTVIEISSKVFSSQLRNTSLITKQHKLLSSDSTSLELIQLQTSGKFASHIFQPSDIHPSIVHLLNPVSVHSSESNSFKRKRLEDIDQNDNELTNTAKYAKLNSFNIRKSDLNSDLTNNNTEDFELENENNVLPIDDDLNIVYDDPEPEFEVSKLSSNNIIAKENNETKTIDKEIHEIDSSHDSLKLITVLRNRFDTKENRPQNTASFKNLTKNASRASASKTFFEILVLATKNVINLEQKTSYEDIQINPSDNFYDSDIETFFKDQSDTEIHNNTTMIESLE